MEGEKVDEKIDDEIILEESEQPIEEIKEAEEVKVEGEINLENKFKADIPKEDIIEEYIKENNSDPTWKDKKQKEMDKPEKNEYKKFRKRVEKKKNKDNAKEIKIDEKPEEYYEQDEKNVSEEDMLKLLISTGNKARRDLLSDEQKAELEKAEKETKFIEDYLRHHNIGSQEKLNYAIEHDEKFKIFLEKTERLEALYTGNHLADIEKAKIEVSKELKKEAEKDKKNKKNKIMKKFARKKQSNVFSESKKELDLTAYKNKKLESQGSILALYLRKNGLAEFRYVKMDEVGQIKVDGYVYHERDAVFRIGKKNTPVLIIMEGALVPINKETLKENLGCTAAEAQKLIIKGIEQAEVVKSSGIDENAKKSFAPPKWVIIVVIVVIIGLYMFLGGSS